MVAKELNSGEELRLWHDELRARRFPPYPLDGDALFLAYYVPAEMKCHLALGWGMPASVIDPFAEFRNLINGRDWAGGAGLLGCSEFYGVPPRMTTEHKTEMRDLVMGGEVDDHRESILEYCASDVYILADIWRKMAGHIPMEQALFRGEYMKCVARMEHAGVPLDVETFGQLKANWDDLKRQLIQDIDADYGVFDGSTFKMERFAAYLREHRIPWPRTDSGQLSLSDTTFRDMAKRFPHLEPLRQLRVSLSQLKLNKLAVGPDGRNRTGLSPFRSVTSRNQPSNARWIFGPSAWMRSLIKPEEGQALAYIDWSQQELGIAAALSQDANMLAAYRSGDFYLAFARQAGAVPATATKHSHASEREQFKVTALAVMYGGTERLIARNTGLALAFAKDLLRLHRRTYPTFWAWRERVVNTMHMRGSISSVFGWRIHRGRDELRTDRTTANFPMQSAGAEMLRLGTMYLMDAGIQVIAPIHDAVLIEAPLPDIDEQVQQARDLMAQASRDVLFNRLELRTDVDVVRYPDRYRDGRGVEMWDSVTRFLAGTSRGDVSDQLGHGRG